MERVRNEQMTSDSAENVRQLKTRRHNINSVLFTMNSINNFYKSATAICYNTAGMSTTVSYFSHSNHVFFVFFASNNHRPKYFTNHTH